MNQFLFCISQEWRQIMPRVEVEPLSSKGSQNVPEILSPPPINDEPMKKRRRQGRKRRRRPQYMTQEEWIGRNEELHQFAQQERGNERYRPVLSNIDDWEAPQNSFQPVVPDRNRESFVNNDREREEVGRWEKPRRPIILRQQESVPEMYEPIAEIRPSNNDFMEEVDPPHPLYKVDEPEIMQSGYDQHKNEKKPTSDKSYRKPYSVKKLEEQKTASAELNPASQLKSILKQTDGLSLSEVLQQKNLSLADLLKGKQMALAALVQNPNSKVAGEEESSNANNRRVPATLKNTATTTEEIDTETNDESEDNPREQKEYRIRNYGRPKKPVRVTESNNDDDDVKPTRRIPFHSTYRPRVHPENTNKVDEESDNLKDDATQVFPSVETKQMALHPVLPVSRGSDRRPIKGIASKIRPDFSNSKVKTEEAFEGTKRRKVKIGTTSSPNSGSASKERERWTPNNGNRERLPSRLPYRPTGKPESSSESSVNNKEHSSTTSTARTPFREKATPVTSSTTPKNMDVIRNRLSLKPRIRLPVRQKDRIRIHSSSTVSPTVNTTEAVTLQTIKMDSEIDSPTTTRQEESDMNVIEKFTSFEDMKPKDVESIDPIFHPRERMPASRIHKIQQQQQQRARNITTTETPMTTKEVESQDLAEIYQEYMDLIGPNVEEEKNEIIQLMEDRRNGNKFLKVLEQRNMSLDELMEHRQRGSSHLHLQELIKTKRKLAERAKMEDRVDIVTAFENFPIFNIGNLKSIQPDDVKTDSNGFSYFTSIINIRPTDEIYKEARALQDMHKIQKATNRQLKTLKFDSDEATVRETSYKQEVEVESSPDSSTDQNVIEHIENEISKVHELLTEKRRERIRPTVMVETAQISGGVKSAIIVSSCIVVVALILFFIIFAIYRWQQKRKDKLNYTESYRMAKGRLPIIHKEPIKDVHTSPVLCAKHRHSSRLGRMNTMDPNSPDINEYLGWDHRKKPFQ